MTVARSTIRRPLAAALAAAAAFVQPTGSACAAGQISRRHEVPGPDELATEADYAAMEFEPVLGLAEILGSRHEWLDAMGQRFPTLWLGATIMAKTPAELATLAAAEPSAILELASSLQSLEEALEAEHEIIQTALVRILAGCCRAGLA